jgi:hypothetical protein
VASIGQDVEAAVSVDALRLGVAVRALQQVHLIYTQAVF